MERKVDTIEFTLRKKINNAIILLYVSLFSSLILAALYIASQIFGFYTFEGVGVYSGIISFHPVISQSVAGIFGTIAGISIVGFILIFPSIIFEFKQQKIANEIVKNEIKQFYYQFIIGTITALMSFAFAFNRVKTGYLDDLFGMGPFYILENAGKSYNFYFLLARSLAILGLTVMMTSFKQLKSINEDIKARKFPSAKQLKISNIHIPFAIILLFVVLDTVLRLAVSSQYIEVTGSKYYFPKSYEIISSVLSVLLFIVIVTMCFIILHILRKNKEAFVSLLVSFPSKPVSKRRIIKVKKEDIPEILSKTEN